MAPLGSGPASFQRRRHICQTRAVSLCRGYALHVIVIVISAFDLLTETYRLRLQIPPFRTQFSDTVFGGQAGVRRAMVYCPDSFLYARGFRLISIMLCTVLS